jgi:hypothetical protein
MRGLGAEDRAGLTCAEVAVDEARFGDGLCPAPGGGDLRGIGRGVVGQGVTFGGDGEGRGQAGEVGVLQRADGGVCVRGGAGWRTSL